MKNNYKKNKKLIANNVEPSHDGKKEVIEITLQY